MPSGGESGRIVQTTLIYKHIYHLIPRYLNVVGHDDKNVEYLRGDLA